VCPLLLQKVFPEAAAFANGSKQGDTFDLPSDDSEDDDFDPNMTEGHMASKEDGSSEEGEDEGSDSDDSNFLTSSDDSEALMDKKKVDDLGLPSEDSEDDDYDPAGPDSDKDIQKERSGSDESDFTSDSDDFCAVIAKSGGHDEVSKPSFPDAEPGDTIDDTERNTVQANTANSSLDPMETEMDENLILPGSGRRNVERLDYKKLYDVCSRPSSMHIYVFAEFFISFVLGRGLCCLFSLCMPSYMRMLRIFARNMGN
jgi:hypothetical protein